MIQSWSFRMLRVQMSSTNSVQGETMHANCFEHKIDWDKRCLSLAGAKPMHVLPPIPVTRKAPCFGELQAMVAMTCVVHKKKIYTVPMKSNRLENQILIKSNKGNCSILLPRERSFLRERSMLICCIFACMHWPKGRHILWASVQPSFAFGSSCFSFLSQMLKFPWPKATSIYITYHTQKSQNLKTKIFSAAVLPSLAPSWFFSAEAKTS